MVRTTLILFVWRFTWCSNTFVRVVYIYICNDLIEETARHINMIFCYGSTKLGPQKKMSTHHGIMTQRKPAKRACHFENASLNLLSI